MSGLSNRVTSDLCARQYETSINNAQADRTFDVRAWTRDVDVAPSLGAGISPDFYGAKRGLRVTQESFLQGRGHTLSNCADCDAISLPTSVFPMNGRLQAPSCQRTDLQAQYTKTNRSCNALTEMSTAAITMFPGSFQQGYLGFNAVIGTQLQTRDEAANCNIGKYE